MSEAFFSALKTHRILPSGPQFQMTLGQLREQMPVTAVDSLFGAYSVAELKQAWPFKESNIKLFPSRTFEGELAMTMVKQRLPWNEAMDRLMNYYEQNKDQQHELKVAEAVALEYPQDAGFCAATGKLCAQLSKNNKAINYFQRAFALEPSMNLARALFALEITNRNPQKAEIYIAYALTVNPDNPVLVNAQSTVKRLINLEAARKMKPADSTVIRQIKEAYASIEQK